MAMVKQPFSRMSQAINAEISSIRLDKWLWAARFYKHRSTATDAVNGGKIKVNQTTAKPARPIRIGDQIDICQDEVTRTVIVCLLADKRGPAHIAQTLYLETPDSHARRETTSTTRKLAATPGADLRGRPTKRDRRQIHRFTQSY